MPAQDSPKLRYEVVQDLVLSLIDSQKLSPGDRLPSSTELADLAGVSLISVRRALDELERIGRITRHQGVGTFVAATKILSEPARLGDLLTTLEQGDAGSKLTTELISLNVGLPGVTIAKTLRVSEGSPVWEVTRGRRLGGAPAIVEKAVLPLSLVPALDEKYLAGGGSLYKFLNENYGITDGYEEQYLEVSLPDAQASDWLELAKREMAVTVKGVSFSDDGVPFDCFQQTYPAHKFVFYVSGTDKHRVLSAPQTDNWSVKPLSNK